MDAGNCPETLLNALFVKPVLEGFIDAAETLCDTLLALRLTAPIAEYLRECVKGEDLVRNAFSQAASTAEKYEAYLGMIASKEACKVPLEEMSTILREGVEDEDECFMYLAKPVAAKNVLTMYIGAAVNV